MLNTMRKVYELFEPSERWTLLGLLGLFIVVALVQTVSIVSILPFMSLAANPQMATEAAWAQSVSGYLGITSTREFLLLSGALVLGLMTLSNAINAFSTWATLSFVRQKEYGLSVRLLEVYLNRPYTFHLERHTSDLAKTILSEVREVISRVVAPFMSLLAQVTVAVFIIALLLITDVKLALGIGLAFGLAYGGLTAAFRDSQLAWGRLRKSSNRMRFKAATEALGGIKEAKVLGREEELVRRFSTPALEFSRANTANSMVMDLPKYALDTITFGGILLMVMYVINSREDFSHAVGALSLYALAAYRLKPAMQGIFSSVSAIRFHGAVVDELHTDLAAGSATTNPRNGPEPTGSVSLGFQRDISVQALSYHYPGTEADVLRNVSLRIPKNAVVAFVGRTGAGKTTLVDIILGLLEPHRGSILIDGVPLSPRHKELWRRQLGYVPQHIFLCDDSFLANIAFGVAEEEIDVAAVERAASIAQLHDFIGSQPNGYRTTVGERGIRLSGGQRQRIGIARALYRDPDVLVLDEATSALDGITENTVIRAIQDLLPEKTIIMVAHRLSTVQDCDTIYLFERGQVVASGSYVELMRSSKSFRGMARMGSLEAVAT
jgi:ATP-binding cassette, subfamily B, bacterial PglK